MGRQLVVSLVRLINTIVTVEPMNFLYYFSFAISLVAWQQTLYIKLCTQRGFNVTQCSNITWDEGHVSLQQQTSYWMIYTNLAVLPPALCCLTMLSGYSNRNSLKLPLILPLVGGIVTTGWIILQIAYLEWDPSLLLIAAAVWGMTGYFPTISMAGMTYVIRDPDVSNLGLRIAVLEGMNPLATAIGTIVAGPIIDSSPKNGLIYAWLLSGLLQLLALADVLFRLKDVPVPKHSEPDVWHSRCNAVRRCFNLDSLKSYFVTVFRKRKDSKRLHLHLVVISTMIGFLSLAGVTGIIFLYITKEYGRSNTEYSIYQGLNCLATLVGSTVFVHILTTRYKMSDIGFTVIGAVSGAISYALLGYADYPVCYWLAVVFRLFLNYTWLGGRLYISHTLKDTEQAAGMGYYATVQCIITLLASLIFNSIYPLTLKLWPGLCFVLSAMLLIATVPALTFVEWNDNRHG